MIKKKKPSDVFHQDLGVEIDQYMLFRPETRSRNTYILRNYKTYYSLTFETLVFLVYCVVEMKIDLETQ